MIHFIFFLAQFLYVIYFDICHDEGQHSSQPAPFPCQGATGLVSVSERLQVAHNWTTSSYSSGSLSTPFSRPCIAVSHPFGYNGEDGEGVLALWMVLETMQTKSSVMSGLGNCLGRQGYLLRSPGTRVQSATSTTTLGSCWWRRLESMGQSMVQSAASASQVS